MGWIVKLGKRNMFGDEVFPNEKNARYAIVCAIRGADNIKDAIRYTKATVVKVKKTANVTRKI